MHEFFSVLDRKRLTGTFPVKNPEQGATVSVAEMKDPRQKLSLNLHVVGFDRECAFTLFGQLGKKLLHGGKDQCC